MKERITFDLSDITTSARVARALSSTIRLQILRLVRDMPLNVSELARLLQIPISSTGVHVNTLEEAGLVITTSKPGLRGSQKVCALRVSDISFEILADRIATPGENVLLETIPIGNYFDFQISAPCGIVSDSGPLESEDRTAGFYLPERANAQLIWFTSGYLEYRFSTERIRKLRHMKSISFSFEICSEAPGYRNDWKSDIEIHVNGLPLAMIHSLGDYGGRRGLLNPEWWDQNNTQFGMLHELKITKSGTYLDEVSVNEYSLDSLKLQERPYLSLRIGVDPNARYMGGLNLFGEKFGDYPQNIVLKIVY
ncbi:MAG: helix-turn-helix domain-containing protein [Ruminococcus sp.]|nr:helix-turn-helix domain-containing protein [Ruminococcus sp.]